MENGCYRFAKVPGEDLLPVLDVCFNDHSDDNDDHDDSTTLLRVARRS